MDYEDRLRVWLLLLRNKLAGKIAPAHPRDHRPTEYALLVPDALAVAEVNAMLDTPITVAHLPAILAQFKHLDPPFDSGTQGGSPASAYGYVLVNGIPRWNNGHRARTETSRDRTITARSTSANGCAENALPAGVHMRLKTRFRYS